MCLTLIIAEPVASYSRSLADDCNRSIQAWPKRRKTNKTKRTNTTALIPIQTFAASFHPPLRRQILSSAFDSSWGAAHHQDAHLTSRSPLVLKILRLRVRNPSTYCILSSVSHGAAAPGSNLEPSWQNEFLCVTMHLELGSHLRSQIWTIEVQVQA